MLTPEYLGSCTDYLLALYDELEEQILQDMARRIVKTGDLTETADWQYKQLQEMGALQDFIYERLAEISGKSDAEIRRLFEESAYQNITTNVAPLISHGIAVEMGLSAPMRQILEANIIRTSGNIKNLTRTIGSTGSMTYYDISNQAFMQAMSGAFSPDYAIREAIRRLGGSGVTVMFPGRKDKLDVAIRRNVRTSVGQTAATITMMQSLQMGVQYYETTAHIGARPEHAAWQGRVFKIEGSDPDHENFYDTTQYGTAGGLCGVNCRHSFFPFWPGISKPAYSKETLDYYNNATVTYNGEEIPYYVATQMQRAMERGIRDTKRKIVVADAAAEAATDESVQNAVGEVAQKQRNVLKKQRGVLTDFCAQTGLAKDSTRVSVVEFGRGAKPPNQRIIVAGIPKSWEKTDDIKGDVVLKGTNPRFLRFLPEYLAGTKEDYTNNCTNCVVAYSQRKKGYNVTARSVGENKRLQSMQNLFTAWVGRSPIESTGTGYEDICEYLSHCDGDALVAITVSMPESIFEYRPGHAFVAEKKGGKIIFLDPQIGKIYTNPKEVFQDVAPGKTMFMRVDDLELSNRGVAACKGV